MKALILAAGRGKRLEHLTEEVPKCFVSLWGKRLIDWNIEALAKSGVSHVAVVTGYHSEKFELVGVGQKIHNPDWASSNMVYSLSLALEWIGDQDCAIIYSDIVFDPGYLDLLKSPRYITLLSNTDWLRSWSERMVNPLQDVETFKKNSEGFLLDIGRKPTDLDGIEGQFMGLVSIPGHEWAGIRGLLGKVSEDDLRKLDFTSFLRKLIEVGNKVRIVECPGRWLEVDSVSDYQHYSSLSKPEYL